jgi:GST-like protein
LPANISIADMASYPWIVPHENQQQDLEDFPHLKRWFETLQKRPAVVRAYEKGQSFSSRPAVSDESRKILFEQTAKTLESPSQSKN